MPHQVILSPRAEGDISLFSAFEQRVIVDAIRQYLRQDADVPTKRRRQLRNNLLAPWELRIGNHRVFYAIEAGGIVRVLAVGYKQHNDLYIRGKKVEL